MFAWNPPTGDADSEEDNETAEDRRRIAQCVVDEKVDDIEREQWALRCARLPELSDRDYRECAALHPSNAGWCTEPAIRAEEDSPRPSDLSATAPAFIPANFASAQNGANPTLDNNVTPWSPRDAQVLRQARRELKQKVDALATVAKQSRALQESLRATQQRLAEVSQQRADEAARYQAELAEARGRHEAFAKKRVEQREKQRMLPVGNDDIQIAFAVPGEPMLAALWRNISNLFAYVDARLAPFQGDVRYIEARFGESVAVYFAFHRWMLKQSLLLSVVMVGVFGIAHLIILRGASDDDAATNGTVTRAPPPAVLPFGWFLWSSFGENERLLCAVTLVCVVVAHALAFVLKLRAALRETYFRTLEEEYFRGARYSRAVFSAIDVTSSTEREVNIMKHSIAASLETLLDSEKRDVPALTFGLVCLRVASAVFQVVLIVATWAALLTLKVYETTVVSSIAGNTDENSVQYTLASLVPSIAITCVNMAIPVVFRYLTLMERWNSPERRLVLQVVRVYSVKILTILILVIQAFEDLTGKTFASWLDSVLSIDAAEERAQSKCPQDQVAADFLLLLLFTLIGKVLGTLFFLHARRYFPSSAPLQQPEFDAAKEIIDLLYLQSLAWFASAYAPFSLFIGAVALWLLFKFEALVLMKHLRRPNLLWSPKEVTNWFLLLYFVTFAVTQASNYYVWTALDDHRCGPFTSLPMLVWLRDQAYENSIVEAIATAISSPFALFFVLCVAVVLDAKRKCRLEAMQEHLAIGQEKLRAEAESYKRQISTLRVQLAKLKETDAGFGD
ncbi:hypothetical protein DIPPA_22125 [Diplonema papillatum]|nr:hypothetical protein DIPPA_22125 [Diplonema papillatum]